MLSMLQKAKILLADKGYDADWIRDALAERKIDACIPSRSNGEGGDPARSCALQEAP